MAELRQRTPREVRPPRLRSHPSGRRERAPLTDAPPRPKPRRRGLERIGLGVLGYVFVFLALAVYFVWLAAQMGRHAPTGIWPLAAVFGAAGAGVVLAGIALALAERRRRK